MQDAIDFFVNVNNLSSGNTIFGFAFGFLKDAGNWADAVAKLIGLVK